MRIKLSDYILEQSVSTSSAIDIELEQLVAEMDVCCKLAMAYNKQFLMEDYFQEETTTTTQKVGAQNAGTTTQAPPAVQGGSQQTNSGAQPAPAATPAQQTQPIQAKPAAQTTPPTNNQQQTNQQTNQQNTQQTNAKQGFFASVWGYIKRFFEWIGNKISGTTNTAAAKAQQSLQTVAKLSPEAKQQLISRIDILKYSPANMDKALEIISDAFNKLEVAIESCTNELFTTKTKGFKNEKDSVSSIKSEMDKLSKAVTIFHQQVSTADISKMAPGDGAEQDPNNPLKYRINGKEVSNEALTFKLQEYLKWFIDEKRLNLLNQIALQCFPRSVKGNRKGTSISNSIDQFQRAVGNITDQSTGNGHEGEQFTLIRNVLTNLMKELHSCSSILIQIVDGFNKITSMLRELDPDNDDQFVRGYTREIDKNKQFGSAWKGNKSDYVGNMRAAQSSSKYLINPQQPQANSQ